jgi:hypothetical protein
MDRDHSYDLLPLFCLDVAHFFSGFGFTCERILIASSRLRGCDETGFALGLFIPLMTKQLHSTQLILHLSTLQRRHS